MYTLHLTKGTVSLAAHIALEELGVPHRLVWLDFTSADQKSADYLAVNPKGRVPTLITAHGALTETAAILGYLAAIHPGAELMPTDPWQRAKVDELELYLASTVHVNHAHKHRGARWSDDPAAWDSMKAKVSENMAAAMALVEAQLTGPWVLGERYSLADPYLYTITRWLPGDGVPLDTFPRLAAHHAAMEQRPAVARAVKMHV